MTEEGLSYVASGVGKPLYADQATEEMGMINFSRACIEIFTEAACPQVLEVFTDDKNFVEVEVEYQNKPHALSAKSLAIACINALSLTFTMGVQRKKPRGQNPLVCLPWNIRVWKMKSDCDPLV